MDKVAALKGHAFRATTTLLGRNVWPGCECGAQIGSGPVNGKTARFVHAEHKKKIMRERAI